MKMNRYHLLCTIVCAALALGSGPKTATAQGVQAQAQNINISFNGPKDQFPYTDQFYSATDAYYQTIGRVSMPGNRHCHVYMSWDVATQAPGSGDVSKEGSRAWFEDFLSAAQGHCDRILVTFKNITGVTVTSPNGYPKVATYQTAVADFLNTDWSYAGWTNGKTSFDYTAWNEPNLASGGGDGYSSLQIPPERAADYYLVLRAACTSANCGQVAAGDFGSNGSTAWEDFVQECSSDTTSPLCSGASYMDSYKYWIYTDKSTYGFASNFWPEVFSYHGWDDINNYINSSSKCTDDDTCTIKAFVNALSNTGWNGSTLWDTEVAAGQNPESNPAAPLQACAAAWLLNLTASTSSRFARIYYTQPWDSNGEYWSLFTSAGATKAAFTVLADREITYSGTTCP
jgi:hypothetical protein